ncbi:MAG: dienelactone hydrolase family protein, partial [Chloroflexota bacterium]
ATSVPGALFNTITYPQEQIDADMAVFYDYLTGLDNVDPTRVGVMGFCFGGYQSVVFAVNNPSATRAVLTYYGGRQPRTEETLEPLVGEDVAVLGVFGAEDASIPLSDVESFENALNSLGVAAEVEVYEGVGHAFVTELEGDSTSAQAWARGIAFLNAQLGETAEAG